MSTKNVETRNKLKSIPKVSTFMELVEACTLSDTDKRIIKMYYLEHKTLSYIADTMGYSESNIKKRHAKILNKMSKLL